MKDVEVTINKFKAVNKADILLNGITVLSGVNSSGKSTISKLLYYTFKYANEFETIVKETIEEKLDAIDSFAFRLSYESKGFGDEYGELKKLFHIYNSNDITLEHKKETLLKLLNKSKDLFNTEPKVKDNQNTFSKDRYIQCKDSRKIGKLLSTYGFRCCPCRRCGYGIHFASTLPVQRTHLPALC